MRRSAPPHPQAGPLQKLFALVVGAVLLVLGLMFSVVALAALAVLGLAGWAYIWWRTRDLRRAMREAAANAAAARSHVDAGDGHIIEGEAIVVVEESRHPGDRQP